MTTATGSVKRPTKAKRKLSDINFQEEGAHVALVSKEQGHGANGHHYAVTMKALNFSDEFVEKASKIKVEMDIVDYLNRFYGIYSTEAEILARTLGFTTRKQEAYALEQQEEMIDDQADTIDPEYPSYDADEKEVEDYIASRIGSIEIMKSLYEADSLPEALSQLDEDEYLMFLEDQRLLEKAIKKIEKSKKAKEQKTKKESKPVLKADDASINSQSESIKKMEKSMPQGTQEVQVMEQEVEVIAKSQFDAISKAFEDQKQELAQALEIVKAFEQEKKEAILKARKADLVQAVKDEAKAEVLFKALKDSAEDDFNAAVKVLGEVQETIEKSVLFQEQGASVQEDEVNQESAVAKVIKARQAKAK